jgi:hypothetical protein
MSLSKVSLVGGIIKLFQPRKSLVSDIPAGNGKIAKLFKSVLDIDTVVDVFRGEGKKDTVGYYR